MNNTQKLVSLISGYAPLAIGRMTKEYYELENSIKKMHYLLDVVIQNEDIYAGANIFLAYEFLESDFADDGHKIQSFLEL